MMVGVTEQCRNRWYGILPQLGIPADCLTGKQTPCPKCGGKDRFRFDNKDGRGTYYCNNCGAGDGVQLAMLVNGWSFRQAATECEKIAGVAPEKAPKRSRSREEIVQAMRDIWLASQRITAEDMAGQYLASRGIDGPYSDALRFIPKLRISGEKVKVLPAMIALVHEPGGEPHSLHRTYLDGPRKADVSSPRRIMDGDNPAGCHIRLWPSAEVMGVAEGIETAERARIRFDMPVWSCLNTTHLEAFTPPPGVRELHIFGDNDGKFGGQAAAYRLAHRIACRLDHIKVHVRIPETVNTDWADAA